MSSVARADAPSRAVCPTTLAVILAGQGTSTRSVQLSTSLGLPVAALPINGERNLIECWVRRLALAGFEGTVILAVSSEADRAFYDQIDVPANVRLRVRVDSNGHRGAGGTLGDVWNELLSGDPSLACASGALVIEASNPPQFDFARFFTAIDTTQGALIGGSADHAPSGISWISGEALALIPRIGFFDLKEQLVAAIVGSGRKVFACIGASESCRITDRESYLRAIALMQSAGAVAVAGDAVIEPGASVRGKSVICRGAVVERGALVVDSAVLPGARVCADAVVARSIVPPGSHVPCGYLVVDETFGELGSANKSGTEGGAS